MISSQVALGRFLSDLKHVAPEVAHRVVTVSPDVAKSTNLGGWINKTGIWSPAGREDWFSDDRERVLRWQEGAGGQHIELGIAEINLVCLASELGSTGSRWASRCCRSRRSAIRSSTARSSRGPSAPTPGDDRSWSALPPE